MSYQALARKWRPNTFDEVLGQEHVVSALRNGLDSQRVHHAFLFTGTRGVGKTTLARIFAKSLNCEQGVSSTPCGKCVACRGVGQGNFIDLIEVDAASRTKVDDTRELLDNVQYTPTQGRFKIYLIDEVHMLSTHSFNALLKTLEEPPEHVKFLLATTDPQKLPTTILSRCIQFNLKAMDLEQLSALLEKILKAEKIKYEPSALLILARSANGSARDALSLLDQGIAFGNGDVRAEKIRTMLGMIDEQFIHQLLTQVCRGQAAEALETVAAMMLRAADFGAALDEILTTLHNISLHQISPQAVAWKGIDATALSELARQVDAELLQLMYQIALLGKRDLSLAPDPRSGFEMILLRMIAFRPDRHATAAAPLTPTPKTAAQGAVRATKAATTVTPPTARHAGAADQDSKLATATAHGDDSNSAKNTEAIGDGAAGRGRDSADSVITLEQLAHGGRWAEWVAQAGLKNLEREMAMNMALRSVVGDTLNLTLDSEHRYLLDAARVKKIEQHFSKKLTRKIQLNVTLGEANGEVNGATEATPSQRQNHAQQEKQQAAEQAFHEDPNVRQLVDLFEAEVDDDSIRAPHET